MHRLVATCLILVLGACAGVIGEGWTLAGEPGLMTKVRSYYGHNAMEEGGQCAFPIMEQVNYESVLEEDDEHLEVLIRYAYRDFDRDGSEDCSRFRPNRCHVMVPCRGIAERSFTIARTAEGSKVVGMSGDQKRRQPVLDGSSAGSPVR